MNQPYLEHPSEEALERFLLHMSPEEELEILETHLLACEYCVEQLENLEAQIAATRLALAKVESDRSAKRSTGSFRRWKNWFTLPRLSFAAAGAVAAIGAVVFSIPRDIAVTAYRNSESVIVSEGRPLRMHLNAAGLAPGPVAVELADGDGSRVWKGSSVVRQDSVDVTLPRIVKSGPHFLRLYAASGAGADGVLLREFALDARWTR